MHRAPGSVRRAAFLVGVVIAALSPSGVGAAAPGSSSEGLPDAGVVSVVAAEPGSIPARAAAVVAGMSTRERAETLVMGHIPTADAAKLAAYMADNRLGGFILMGSNVPASAARLRENTAAIAGDSALPPLIAVDQEGGDVSRLDGDEFASALTLKRRSASATEDAFAARGALVQAAGISANFGIVADVARSRGDFIFGRSLGMSATDAAARTAAAVAGESGQALSTLKHYPGHGAAAGDSHEAIPSTGMSLATWRRADAVPFAHGIEAGAELLMFGHLSYPKVDRAPASLSARWHEIARDELGFTGVSITDDLGMLQASGQARYRDPVANAVRAIAAGNDMVLAVVYTDADSAGRIVDGIEAAASDGAIEPARLEEAAIRVVTLRLSVAAGGRGLAPCAGCG